MNTKRLMKLIDFMEKFPRSKRKQFHMQSWFKHSGDNHKHVVGRFITKAALDHCGTTACALGWAAVVPSLQKAGLRVPAMRSGPEPIEIAKRFFEIHDEQAYALFNPGRFSAASTPNTPKQWARMARRLLKEWNAK